MDVNTAKGLISVITELTILIDSKKFQLLLSEQTGNQDCNPHLQRDIEQLEQTRDKIQLLLKQ